MLGAVADILRARGSEGWLVGGSVRDLLLGQASPDVDVVVADDAEQVAKQLASVLRAPWFSLSERYPTYRVLGAGGHIDLTSVRGADIVADLAARDFTINAMAVPMAAIGGGVKGSAATGVSAYGSAVESVDAGLLLDPFNGALHLRQKRLVATSDQIFTEDALRLMRAARFCHTLGLAPDAELLRMIQEQAMSLGGTAVERVVNEMCITLAAGRSADVVRLWDGLGLLGVVLPECAGAGVGSGARVDGAAVTREQAWQTKLASLDALDELLEDPAEWFPDHADFLVERMTRPVDGVVTRPVALRLAGSMGRLGVGEVTSTGRRLKLSGALVSLLCAYARCLSCEEAGVAVVGAAPAFRGMLAGGATVSRAAVLFMWDATPWEPEIVMLGASVAAADIASTGGDPRPDQAIRHLMSLAVKRARGELPSPPVDGEVLMRELGLESGPTLGSALREVRLAWESEEAVSSSELVEMARQAALR